MDPAEVLEDDRLVGTLWIWLDLFCPLVMDSTPENKLEYGELLVGKDLMVHLS